MMVLGRVRRLGQPPVSIPFKVVVTDSRGAPFKGAKVYLSSNGRPLYDASTDSAGIAEAPAGFTGGPIDVRIEVDGYVINRRVDNTDETLFVQIPVCGDSEILTYPEMGLLVGAAALAWSGVRYKMGALKTTAEIILGAVVFNAVFRANCRG
jgi:hypothetical protein